VVVRNNFLAVKNAFFDVTENNGEGGKGGEPVPILLHR